MQSDSSKITVVDWIVYGIAFIFVTGSLMHYVYRLSGSNPIVGLFAPISESVWEHLKIVYWPSVIWWTLGYLLLHKREDFRASRWFMAGTVAVVTGLVLVITLYYTITGGFGLHSVLADIIIFFLATLLAQILGFHIFQYAGYSPLCLYLSLAVLLLLAAIFAVFTGSPPDLPIFQA